jgi:hypothetical protein
MEQTVNHFLKKLTLPYVVTLLFFIAFLVYGNALLNEFVGDDKAYIINDPQTHVINLPLHFGSNFFNDSGQYRPLAPVYFSILYTMFGAAPFPYHVLQILLHVTASTLLYVLFRKFLSTGVALFLTLIFLIHPIQVESVSYIAQTASPLFFLLGIIPLLLGMPKNISSRTAVVIFILLLLSLFEKETGVLFLLLMFVYTLLYFRNNLKRLAIGGGVTLAVYAFFRIFIGHVLFEKRLLVPIAGLPLFGRLLNAPAIMFSYLKTFFYPKTLAYDQAWIIPTADFQHLYLPLTVDQGFSKVAGKKR